MDGVANLLSHKYATSDTLRFCYVGTKHPPELLGHNLQFTIDANRRISKYVRLDSKLKFIWWDLTICGADLKSKFLTISREMFIVQHFILSAINA